MAPVRCYFDGKPCDCMAFDVAADCPRDTYAEHGDSDEDDEEE